MSLEAINAVRQMDIRPCGRKFIAMALADYADEEGGCYPSVETLAKYTSQGEKTVRDHLNALEEMGFLTRERSRNNQGQLGQYRYKIDHRRKPPVAKTASGEKRKSPPAKSAAHIHQTPNLTVRDTPDAREEISQEHLDAIWEAYPDDGKVSTAKANLPFRMAGPIKWLGSLEAVLAAVRAYAAAIRKADQKPKSIVNFLSDRALLERYSGSADQKPVSDTDRLRALIFEFKRYGDWKGDGPPPGKPGCKAPPELLAEFGYAERAA